MAFDLGIFLQRATEFENDPLIRDYIRDERFTCGVTCAAGEKGLVYSFTTSEGMNSNEVWEKMHNALRRLRFFYQRGEPTSIHSFSEWAKASGSLSPELKEAVGKIQSGWAACLELQESGIEHGASNENVYALGAFHGRRTADIVLNQMYGDTLHSDADKRAIIERDREVAGDSYGDYELFILIRIMSRIAPIIESAKGVAKRILDEGATAPN